MSVVSVDYFNCTLYTYSKAVRTILTHLLADVRLPFRMQLRIKPDKWPWNAVTHSICCRCMFVTLSPVVCFCLAPSGIGIRYRANRIVIIHCNTSNAIILSLFDVEVEMICSKFFSKMFDSNMAIRCKRSLGISYEFWVLRNDIDSSCNQSQPGID